MRAYCKDLNQRHIRSWLWREGDVTGKGYGGGGGIEWRVTETPP